MKTQVTEINKVNLKMLKYQISFEHCPHSRLYTKMADTISPFSSALETLLLEPSKF